MIIVCLSPRGSSRPARTSGWDLACAACYPGRNRTITVMTDLMTTQTADRNSTHRNSTQLVSIGNFHTRIMHTHTHSRTQTHVLKHTYTHTSRTYVPWMFGDPPVGCPPPVDRKGRNGNPRHCHNCNRRADGKDMMMVKRQALTGEKTMIVRTVAA